MNQPIEVRRLGGWGLSESPFKERGARSVVGRIQVRPQQGLSGRWRPSSVDSFGSLVKEMGKLRPRNRGGDLTKVIQQVVDKGHAHPRVQTRPTAAAHLPSGG